MFPMIGLRRSGCQSISAGALEVLDRRTSGQPAHAGQLARSLHGRQAGDWRLWSSSSGNTPVRAGIGLGNELHYLSLMRSRLLTTD
jgi:hypothetical protein